MRPVNRRNFMKLGTGAGVGFIGTLLSIPAIGFVLSPLFQRTRLSWVTVGPIDDIPLNSPTALVTQVPTGTGWPTPAVPRVVYVVRTSQTEVIALSNVCSHMQCDVHFDKQLDQFLCPCHGGLYDKRGINVGGPPPAPLPQWVQRVRVDDQGRHILEIQNQFTTKV
ncbi:MAG: ubiquinol-cytochrome c reductase iron-sulfur subunit [Candidatus Dormibacteria bacterium]